MEKSNFEKVIEFHTKFGSYIGNINENIDEEILNLRLKLIEEEFNELKQSKTLGNKIKELCDLLYVTYGYLIALGVNADKAFADVHNSNMSKLGPGGYPIYREDGKILKGPFYKPVDENSLLKHKI